MQRERLIKVMRKNGPDVWQLRRSDKVKMRGVSIGGGNRNDRLYSETRWARGGFFGGGRAVCSCYCGESRSGLPVSSRMRRCMSSKVGKNGRVIQSKGLDFMTCLLARFCIGVESYCSVVVVAQDRFQREQFNAQWNKVSLGVQS